MMDEGTVFQAVEALRKQCATSTQMYELADLLASQSRVTDAAARTMADREIDAHLKSLLEHYHATGDINGYGQDELMSHGYIETDGTLTDLGRRILEGK